ncbi:hypothetical protein BDV97DRAFT_420525 [Delphinella strobiligena]|nr:hypothetical protein BDV97DRAFT_420525 [Delphinella strobiligena]
MDDMYRSYEPYLNQTQGSQEDHEPTYEQSYEQDNDEQTGRKGADQQSSLHPYQLDSRQPSPIEVDTSPRIFSRRLSTQDEDILLFAGQNPKKDDWPDISAAYSQKHGYRSPEACRKRYYILEPRNREYTKRKNAPSQGRRPRHTRTTQVAVDDKTLLPSAITRSTIQHASPIEQQLSPAEPAVSHHQLLQPVTYTAITKSTSATATFNRTSFLDTYDNDQPNVPEQWTQDYSHNMQD